MAKTVDKPDYYSILNVTKEASRDEVRTSYKLLAMRMHPDKNRDDPSATQKFQKLVEAYSVLTDPVKREQYDRFGTVEEDYEEACECGKHHHHNFEDFMAFRNFFTEMFNRHYKTHGFDGFVVDSDSDEEEETFVQNLWGSYGTRTRFAADWDSVPRAMYTEKQLKYQGSPPDKPGRPKATTANNKIKIEWAKKNSSKEVLFYILSMKTPVADWFDVFQGDAKSFELTPTVGGTHSFRVAAGNRAGKSQPSESVSVSVVLMPEKPTTTKSTATAPKAEVTTPASTAASSSQTKKKKANAGEPKVGKVISDLQFALEAADVEEVKKHVLAASSIPSSSSELASLVQKGLAFVEQNQFSQLHKALVDAIDSKNLAEIESLLSQLSSFDKYKKSIERDLNRAILLLSNEQQSRENAAKMLQQAMDQRDLNKLVHAIEIAKKLNVPVRDAKKFQRKLEKGDTLREQLLAAAENGDKLSLQELIRQAKEKNFPFDKELKIAQEKLQCILNEEDSLLKELYGL